MRDGVAVVAASALLLAACGSPEPEPSAVPTAEVKAAFFVRLNPNCNSRPDSGS
ncbi:hypothetical protein [Mycobacteroides abscessus]|uniref:hypothetical protein n=1 Tax=Mycobacteroides abscessus TaxID=36809 RepID=UPI0013F62E1A|nr:hypothetical protein [Mycobacteroides abscessus]